MADDVQLSTNIGTGDVLRADEAAGGEKIQYVKLMDSTSSSESLVGYGPGTEAACLRVTLPTDGTGVVKLGAGSASVGSVSLGVHPTAATTSPYTTEDTASANGDMLTKIAGRRTATPADTCQ